VSAAASWRLRRAKPLLPSGRQASTPKATLISEGLRLKRWPSGWAGRSSER